MGCIAIARLSILETLRRKEFYVVFALVTCLAVWMQLANLGASGAGRFAKDIIMQVTWLASFALATPLAARQIASDLEQKTVYVLMSRPIHRWHYVFGRAIGASLASVICFTIMYLVLVTMLLVKGANAITDPCLWQAYALQVVALVMLCSLAVFFSSFSTPAGAITFSFLLLVLMRYGGPSMLKQIEAIPGIVRDFMWAAYLVFPHFEFFNMSQRVVHNWGPLPSMLFAQVLLYGIAYSIFIVASAALVFRKRWL